MDDAVVDTAAAVDTAGSDGVDDGFVLCVNVQRQGLFPAVDGVDDFFDGFEGQHGQDGAENFLLHHGVIPGDVVQHCGLDLQSLGITLAADDNFLGIDEAHEAVEVAAADDVAGLSVVVLALTRGPRVSSTG